MLFSTYLLSAICYISAVAGHKENEGPKVVRIAIINGQKYELKAIVEKAKPKKEEKPFVASAMEKNWQKKPFGPRSMSTKEMAPAQNKEVSHKPDHHHRHRHGHHHHPHHPHHGHHHHRRHHRKHHHCPCRGRRFNKAALFRTKPSFIKVVVIKETMTVDQDQKPLFKEIETTTNVYMKNRNKPFHKVSSSSNKAIVIAPKKMKKSKDNARPIIKAQAMKEETPVKNLDENHLVFFLLGMCSMLGFFAFVKGMMFLFKNDSDDSKHGYLKLDVEENATLLKEEQNVVAPAINQV